MEMGREPSQGALMLAREMTMLGVSQDEIVACLRERFSIEGAEEVARRVTPQPQALTSAMTPLGASPEKKVV